MIVYREATIQDIGKIALLHTQSWQKHYRGILLDEFLDNHVYKDRLEVWQSRLANPPGNQYILLAESNSILCGLACVFANHDPVYGALLDNLHVLTGYNGQGIGSRLLKSAAEWSFSRNPYITFYLWVYEKNLAARKFYESLGAINQETIVADNPGGGSAPICRYVWTDIQQLLN